MFVLSLTSEAGSSAAAKVVGMSPHGSRTSWCDSCRICHHRCSDRIHDSVFSISPGLTSCPEEEHVYIHGTVACGESRETR